MFYKIRNILIALSVCAFVLPVEEAKAQGLVSLSEEAMFEDGLDTETGTKAPEIPVENNMPKGPNANPGGPVIPKGPNANPGGPVIPKGPNANPNGPIIPKGPNANLNGPIVPKGPNAVLNNPAPVSAPVAAPVDSVGASNLANMVDESLFKQMSEIEKKTAILNLELKRERLQNEVEAVKNQRKQALIAEQEKAEAERLRKLEAEKKIEKELLIEKEKLRELDMKFEVLRQEKVLDAYKNKVLEENQKWIEHNAAFYKQIADLRSSKKNLVDDFKAKMNVLRNEALNVQKALDEKDKKHKEIVNDLNMQMEILRKRVSTMETERETLLNNPFAGATPAAGDATTIVVGGQNGEAGVVVDEPLKNDLSTLYAVTEIRGKGGELIARLINKNGIAFYVKKGTALQSGHIIGDITTTYVVASKGAEKEYLYFAAGGILPTETKRFEVGPDDKESD